MDNITPVDWRYSLAFFTRYLRPYRGAVMGMAALLLAGIALQLVNPQVIRYFLDTAQPGADQRHLQNAAILFIGFAILQQAARLAASYLSKIVGWLATNQLRADLTLHCLRLDMPFHKAHTPGELIERIDGDVTQLANFFSAFAVQLLGNGLLVIGILVMLFRENTRIGAAMFAYMLVTLFAIGMIQRLAVPRWAAARQTSADLFGYLEERIDGAEEIRAMGAEPYAMRRLDQIMRPYLRTQRAAFVVGNLTYNLTSLVYVLGYAIGLVLGVYLYLQGNASLGTAYLLVYYIGMLVDPLQGIREQAQDFQKASASLQRIRGLLHLAPTVQDPIGSSVPMSSGALEAAFENVTFGYDAQEDVLQQVTFTIPAGHVLGVIGRTGSGKSTLTRLLFRLYDPQQGVIRLNGVNVRQLTLADLRQQVGMVTQDVQLFQATVRDNLTFFDSRIGDDVLRAVLQSLNLWGWVEGLPHGLDTRLGSEGQGLSAGEAQLLAFGRVFLRDPGLIILDEASSRLDLNTEAVMENAIDRLFAGRTGVVIAHRLQTVQRADDILILEGGRVVEFGARRTLAEDPKSHFSRLLHTGVEEVLA